ncbi:MAG: carboxymuconolactone decarboxylase [Ramlibacter sp.]|nr:carboxymuconolactone decarboxylase [Ramlibacter sp.]
MARLPYADIEGAAVAPVVEQIVAQRGSVLHLYQMLLHSPPLAQGWLAFLTAIRQKSSLPGDIRELVIMRVAILNGAPYEAEQHAPIALAEGVTQDQLHELPEWQASWVYSATQRAVLALTDAMTRDVHVAPAVFEEARAHFDGRAMVDLVATVAAYNMVSRFLEALEIHSTDQR